MVKKYKYIHSINSPEDLKKLKVENLHEVCDEIRNYIIDCCSTNPGHLGASLGAVDIIVGLHYTYNTPQDKLIFDVGHQAYAHKIITGRREAFKNNRKKDGISGFPKMSESPYDAFGTGHSSTSISAGIGISTANKILGKDDKVAVLIGDGAMTGGLAIEAMNNAKDTDILVILNDNNQSIDSNTGAVHEYLLKLTTHPAYNKLKSTIWDKIGNSKIRKKIQEWTVSTKSNLVRTSGGALFEALGFRYFGPIDGNNIETIVETLQKLRTIPGPKLLHINTIKGKGYKIAEDNPTIWHAPGKFNPENGERHIEKSNIYKYQDVFGQVLCELAQQNPKIVGITPAMSSGCGMNNFAQLFPERFFDVGIEEEHATTFSAGLASIGMKPFCNIYSSFSQRAYDQIIHDVAIQNLPVVFCFDRAGLVGEDGATHQGCYDMAAYRSIPNCIISSPLNEIELKNLMYTASTTPTGPFIIRYPRGNGEGVDWKNSKVEQYEVGKSQIITEGTNTCIIGIGPILNNAIKACRIIEEQEGWTPGIVNLRFLKPIDTNMLNNVFNKYATVISIEDGCLKGGLFGELCEYAQKNGYTNKIVGLGIDDIFIEQDNQQSQRKMCNLDTETILLKIKELKK